MATLTISFTAPIPAPYGGFTVKYRPIGTTTYTTVTPNPTSSPVVITGLAGGVGYEGTISSSCGNSINSPEQSFAAYSSTEFYAMYNTTPSLTCVSTPTIVYIQTGYSDITTGMTVYTNPGLTTPLSGANYILSANGTIYNISNVGVVGASTGSTC